jgi:hypothetical protein
MLKENEIIIADGIKFLSILFFKDLLDALFSPSLGYADDQKAVVITPTRESCCDHC